MINVCIGGLCLELMFALFSMGGLKMVSTDKHGVLSAVCALGGIFVYVFVAHTVGAAIRPWLAKVLA